MSTKQVSKIQLTRPGPNVLVWWAVQWVLLAALGGVAFLIAEEKLRIGVFLGGMIITLPINLVIFGFSMLFWVPRMKERRWVVQDAELEGTRLTVREPAVMVSNLELGYAARVGRDGDRWSVTFFRDGRPPLTLLVESRRREDFPGQGRFVEPEALRSPDAEVGISGFPEVRLGFGDALLAALEATASENRLLAWREKLAARETSTADEPFAVELERDGEGSLDAYRSGRPQPGQPGFLAWAEREGLRLAPDLVLSAEHLVCTATPPIAFPIGATKVEVGLRRLRLLARDAHGRPLEADVPLEDAALAEALAELADAKPGGDSAIVA